METYKNIVMPLTEEKEKLENENKAQKEIIQKLGGTEVLNKLNENNGENGELNTDKEINALKQKISEQNNVSEELRKILNSKDKESDEYKKNLGEITEQLETYKNAVTLLTEEKGEYMNECQQLKENIKKLEYELSLNKPGNSSINTSTNLSNTNDFIDNSKEIKEIKELKEKISERDGLIQTLQGIISGDKDISVLKTDGIDYKEKYNKLNEEKEEIEKQLNDIKQDKNTAEKNNKLNMEKNKRLEEEINDYKNNNLKLSNDNNELNKKISELKNKILNDKDNKAINKKMEELANENESIKNNAIKEHELIASSMFELAIQYFNMKKELDEMKNIQNNENSNLTWVEIERRKNFPCEYYN
jgi:chromosome segregation ATPase